MEAVHQSMTPPLISVCIPCHNAGNFVGAALDSVLAQTWPNLEIIVVDDDSTDQSSHILASYKARGVKVIKDKLGNAAKARNRAVSEATGSYLKFFDADDLMSPKMLSSQMQRIGNDSTAIASGKWGRFYHNDLSTFSENQESVWRDMDPSDWLVAAWRNARPMTQPGLFLIPFNIWEKAGPWDESLSLIDDFEFFARVLCHSHEVRYAPEAILYYRSGLSNSLSQRKSRGAVESAYNSLMKGISHLLTKREDANARLSCANLCQDFIYSYYPNYSDLCQLMTQRVTELGGSDLAPDGPPRFHKLKKMFGWKVARRIQVLANR